SDKHPESIIVGLNDRVPQNHDQYLINLNTGERTLLLENPGFLGFVIDEDFVLRFALKMERDGSIHMLKRDGEGWQPWQVIPQGDALTTEPIGLDESGHILYMAD